MEIVIVNQPLNNRGDEAAHKSLVRMLNLEIPNAVIKVLHLSANQNSVEQFRVESEQNKYINIPMFKGHSFLIKLGFKYNLVNLFNYIHPSHKKVSSLIKNSDLVICAPGGVCMGPYQDWRHLWFLKVAFIFNKKVAYYGRSFGPFPIETKSQVLFKKKSLEILNKLDFISLRDSVTQDYAKELKLNYIDTVDTALLDTPNVVLPVKIIEEIGSNYVVFVPNELKWNPVFRNIDSKLLEEYYISIINYLLKIREDFNIVMLPQLFNNKENNDIDYFKYLSKKINSSRLKVISDQYSSDIQQTVIARAIYLIGARYHSVVFSINNEISFTALSYEHKISGLLKVLGLQNNLVDFSFLLVENGTDRQNKMNEALQLVFKMISEVLVENKIQKKRIEHARFLTKECKNKFIEKYK